MTDRRDFDDGAPGPDGLEAFFAAARGDAAQPDGALLSRIEADALAALPRPARTKRRGAGWRPPQEEGERRAGGLSFRPRAQLRDVARDLERQLFVRLFKETGGDFEAMAERLLEGDDPGAGRKVRLRFNQLGLRVKELER